MKEKLIDKKAGTDALGCRRANKFRSFDTQNDGNGEIGHGR